MRITAQLTYDVYTQESAEDGGTADNGFYAAGGWQYSIADDAFEERCKAVGRQQALADMAPEPLVLADVAEAVALVEEYGASETDGGWGGKASFYQVDPSYDRAYFERGEDTRICVHIKCDDPAVLAEIVAGVG